MATREERLVRCKEEAIARLEAGDLSGAIASMISEHRKRRDTGGHEATLFHI
jgi:hypothetical protein